MLKIQSNVNWQRIAISRSGAISKGVVPCSSSARVPMLAPRAIPDRAWLGNRVAEVEREFGDDNQSRGIDFLQPSYATEPGRQLRLAGRESDRLGSPAQYRRETARMPCRARLSEFAPSQAAGSRSRPNYSRNETDEACR